MTKSQTITFNELETAAKSDGLTELFAKHDGRVLIDALPDDWEVRPYRGTAPLVAIHVPTDLILPCTVNTLLERVGAIANHMYALPPMHQHRVVKTLTVFILEGHRGYNSRYFVADATDWRVETLSAEQMWEHATNYTWPATDTLAPMEIPEPKSQQPAVVEPAEAKSPRRLEGRPAGQHLSARPTRQAVEVMGNPDVAELDGAAVIDVIARLMRDGYEYSDALAGIESLEVLGLEETYPNAMARLVALGRPLAGRSLWHKDRTGPKVDDAPEFPDPIPY